MKTSRKQIENWFLKKAYDERQFIQAEMLEAMVATFLYLYEEASEEVIMDSSFCLNHYDTPDMYTFSELYVHLLEDAWKIGYESHEGYEKDCDCDEVDMSDFNG